MGLFNYDYESAGPGIAKNAPQKKGLALFFDIFYRKKWKITGLNILFFIFFIPVILMLPAVYYIKQPYVCIGVLAVLFLIFTVNIGPALAGMTKVMRFFIIERHTFVMRDFFKGYKQNFKKASIIGVLDVLVAASAYAGYNVYPDLAQLYNSKIFYVPLILTFSIALVAVMMNYYIFLMMTATDLSLKNLIKNSFALAFVSLKQNIITTVMIVILGSIMVILLLYAVPLFMLVMPFFPAALMWFIACFNSYPVIQKYVIDPFYAEKGEINPEKADVFDEIDEETVFEDMGGKEKPIEKRAKGKGKHIS